MIPGLWHIVYKAADGRPEEVRSSDKTAKIKRLFHCTNAKALNEREK